MEHESREKNLFGFWLYLMSDVVLFATLFAVFAVLRGETFGGPTSADILNPPLVLAQTLILLLSSFTVGLALVIAARAVGDGKTWPSGPERRRPQFWQRKEVLACVALLATLILGLIFLGLEIYEFSHLILSGEGPGTSAFLSAFFALVGTHGLHVAFGSLWMIVVMFHLLSRGIGASLVKLQMLVLFWHFLDIVWIFIFSLVYLSGVLI
jgi:cytochrome o ubiquinol oxidase subunit 3